MNGGVWPTVDWSRLGLAALQEPEEAPPLRSDSYIAYGQALAAFTDQLPPEWSASVHPITRLAWHTVQRRGIELPPHGWKLHISASPPNMVELVQRVLPELITFEVAFKLPTTLDGVKQLNAGHAGRRQIGKVVTVYPASDHVLRQVVEQLDPLWRPMGAPAIVSDLPVGEGGALWIRFGAFFARTRQFDSLGRPWIGIETPAGEIVPDARRDDGEQVAWAPPPPVVPAARRSRAAVDQPITVADDRFLPLKLLSNRAHGTVTLALRQSDCTLFIMRTAISGVACDEYGVDAVVRLANEYAMLTSLAETEVCPAVVAYAPDHYVLITEDIAGTSLAQLPPTEQLTQLPAVAQALARMHAAGVVHRDVKPANVLITPAGPRLIDLELAARVGMGTPGPMGTNGYAPPEAQFPQVAPSFDVYSLGACLTHAMLGFCPSRLPVSANAGRQLGLLKHHGMHRAANLAAQLLSANPDQRPTAASAAALLIEESVALREELALPRRVSSPGVDRHWALGAAVNAGLASRSFLMRRSIGHCWRNAHIYADFDLEGINLGAAGILIGLASIDTAIKRNDFQRDLIGGAEWLAGRPGSNAAGLFMGNAGVAVALTMVGRRFSRPDLLAAARQRFSLALEQPAPGYDLFGGMAGVLWASCQLSAMLGSPEPLWLAHPLVVRLTQAVSATEGLLGWPASAEYDANRAIYLGAAHGASGIALALCDWGRRIGDWSTVQLGMGALERIVSHGLSAANDNIRATVGGKSQPAAHWCHGVAGYLWCLIQAVPDQALLRAERAWAIRAFINAAPELDNPTYCHGLAGMLEILRMLRTMPAAAPTAAARAAAVGAVLRVLHQHGPSGTTWASEDPAVITPDLWLGFLGPATNLAMFARSQPLSVLSPDWLAQCAASVT